MLKMEDAAAIVKSARTFTPDQLRRAKRLRDILWNSTEGMAMSEDQRIAELEQWCIAATGDNALADKLMVELLLP